MSSSTDDNSIANDQDLGDLDSSNPPTSTSGSSDDADPDPDSTNSGGSSDSSSGDGQSDNPPPPTTGGDSDGPTEANNFGARPIDATQFIGFAKDKQQGNANNRTQDPFAPQKNYTAPFFLDSQACFCALQKRQDPKLLWHCTADQGDFDKTLGKFFFAKNGNAATTKLPFDDFSNPPDTATALLFNSDTKTFEPSTKFDGLSPFDQACTGIKRNGFTNSIHRAMRELNFQDLKNHPPVDAFPCIIPNAIPLTLDNVTHWAKEGCLEGFRCENNTVNSLPQFCPPVTVCQKARVLGQVCQIPSGPDKGQYVPMGAFEPVACQAGFYCPKNTSGPKQIKCPSGTFCQPGASAPTPCAPGSQCPEGSVKQVFFVPIALVFVLDALLILGMVIILFRNRFRSKAPPKALTMLRAKSTKYRVLEDEPGIEMEATYMPNREGPTGFEAIFELYGSTVEKTTQELSPQLQKFVDSMRRATDASSFGLSFRYENLIFQPNKKRPPILQKVTGKIETGSLVAVMGGSGAGKSTFVNVLMGKTANTGGHVSVNNQPGRISRYKKLIGFVPQDDIVLPELTVYENILHSARIRLPRSWSFTDIQSHVDCVIDCLELSHVRDSLVGSISKPVISGGQRKRVSIGMELAAAPMAIFLDEPTSGLDATAASSIMRTLKAISRLGISIITIIHQPRAEIWEMIDDLILLGNGQIIYEGSQTKVQEYFEGFGFHFPEHTNHSDIVTDIITGNGRDYKPQGQVSKESLIDKWAELRDPKRFSVMVEAPVRMGHELSIGEVLKIRGAPRFKQFWLCLLRAMLQQYRAKGTFWAEMGLAMLAGLLLGLAQASKNGVLFTGLYKAPYDILSVAADFTSAPQMALLVVIAIGLVGSAPGVKVFSEELLLYRRESEAGHSRIAYFMAKMVSAFPRMIWGCLHFTTPLLLLSAAIIPWFTAFGTNLLYFYCVYGLASVVSMVARREDAPLFATMIALVAGILCGAAPPLAKVKQFHAEFLWRASPATWVAELYFGQLVNPFAYLYDVDFAAARTGYSLTGFSLNLAMLVTIGTVYRVIAYVGLIFGNRLRR